MNEISKQIIEVGKLIGKKVFVKRYDGHNEVYYNDSETPELFTVDDFDVFCSIF